MNLKEKKTQDSVLNLKRFISDYKEIKFKNSELLKENRVLQEEEKIIISEINVLSVKNKYLENENKSLRDKIFELEKQFFKKIQENKRLKDPKNMTDTLTKIPNYNGFIEFLKKKRKWERKQDGHLNLEKINIGFLTVNNLKAVNDRFNSEIGDALLKKIATLLKKEVFSFNGVICRKSGVEFIFSIHEPLLNQNNNLKILIKNINNITQGINNYYKTSLDIKVYSNTKNNNISEVTKEEYINTLMHKANSEINKIQDINVKSNEDKNYYTFYENNKTTIIPIKK